MTHEVNGTVSSWGNDAARKNKFNGKEYEKSLELNVTEMDFRQYDPAIGRFNCVDPLAEQSYSITPYHFGYDNPNFWSDPSGLQVTLYVGGDNFQLDATGIDAGKLYSSIVAAMDGVTTDFSTEDYVEDPYESSFAVGAGFGGYYYKRTISSYRQGKQEAKSWTCTYENKLSVDNWYCVSGQDLLNASWLDYSNRKDNVKKYAGLKPFEIIDWYKKGGYAVTEYPREWNNENIFKWIYNEMGNGNIIQMVIGPRSSGHNVSVIGVFSTQDYRHMKIDFMNPVEGSWTFIQGFSSAVQQIYSVSRP